MLHAQLLTHPLQHPAEFAILVVLLIAYLAQLAPQALVLPAHLLID